MLKNICSFTCPFLMHCDLCVLWGVSSLLEAFYRRECPFGLWTLTESSPERTVCLDSSSGWRPARRGCINETLPLLALWLSAVAEDVPSLQWPPTDAHLGTYCRINEADHWIQDMSSFTSGSHLVNSCSPCCLHFEISILWTFPSSHANRNKVATM